MRFRPLFLVPVALLGLSLSAQASDITFNVTAGTLSPGGSFSGSFLINSATESIDGGSFSVIEPLSGSPFALTTFTSSTVPGLGFFSDAAGDKLTLALNGTLSTLQLNTFANYGSADTNFVVASGTRFEDTGGIVTPASVAATPEPSSLVLLGTGALGVAGAFRRRFLA